ncbi:MAG: tRNA lysidine(34) synthetase TilS [Oligoflexia bacterium]|nr:tRNA lysidine(34) synthetase TilS [Oligoflexia bacterium]
MQQKQSLLVEVEKLLLQVPQDGVAYIACSGGVDSVVLFHLMVTASTKRKLKVLHFNHRQRGVESDNDEAFVRTLAKQKKISFVCKRYQDKKSTQEKLRDWRNREIEKIVSTNDRIFLAHHKDDQAETIFMNILRGTGLNGLVGMRPVQGKKIRPLLLFTKKQIVSYAQRLNYQWRDDSSNSKNYYDRNWIRNQIFPLLEERRPGIANKLTDLSKHVQELLIEVNSELISTFTLSKTEKFYYLPKKNLSKYTNHFLSSTFGLSSKHTAFMRELLKKGSGTLTAPGRKYSYSNEILCEYEGLIEHRYKDKKLVLQSVLGEWKHSADIKIYKESGDKRKKLYQNEKVPHFLRSAIPIFTIKGRPEIVFLKKQKEVSYSPSGLASWIIDLRK